MHRMTEILRAGPITLAAFCMLAASASAQPDTDSSAKVTVDRDGVMHMPAYRLPPSVYVSDEAKEVDRRIRELRKSPKEHEKYLLDRAKARYPVTIEERRIGGVRTDVVIPRGGIAKQNQDRVLINLHGGGFFCQRTWQLVESIPIASTGAIKVVSVDYRCAPQDKFPAASEDVATVYKELLKEYKPQNIGIYGCSAGGLLATEAVAWFQKEKLPRPGAIGVFCAADHILGGDSKFMAPSVGARAPPPTPNPPDHPELYFSNVDVRDALVSPAMYPEILAKFPPTLLITATRDALMSSVLHAHSELVKVGVDAELHVWDGLTHCFFFAVDMPEAQDMFRVTVKFFENRLGKST